MDNKKLTFFSIFKHVVSTISEDHARDLKFSFIAGITAGLCALFPLFYTGVLSSPFLAVAVILLILAVAISGLVIGILCSQKVPTLPQLVKFGTVGGLNAFLELTIVNVLIFATGAATGAPFAIFKAISFLIAVINGYFWSKHWTFESRTSRSSSEFFKFVATATVGLIINVGTASFLVSGVGAPPGIGEVVWANSAVLFAIFVAMTWNFLSMKFIIFKEQ